LACNKFVPGFAHIYRTSWETSVVCLIGTLTTNMGFWAGTRLKQRKCENTTKMDKNDSGAPWRMNFKLNEPQ